MSMTINDKLLHHIHEVQQNRNGSDASFRCIWEACLPSVKSAIAKVGLQGPDMEDTIQETCLAIWKTIPTFNSKRSSISSYAYIVARRRALDLIRGNRRRSKRDAIFEILLKIDSLRYDSGSQNESRDEHRLLEFFIARYCDNTMKEIIHLAAAEFSFPEIAREMEMKVSTVKTRWQRFCKKFNKYHAIRVTP